MPGQTKKATGSRPWLFDFNGPVKAAPGLTVARPTRLPGWPPDGQSAGQGLAAGHQLVKLMALPQKGQTCSVPDSRL